MTRNDTRSSAEIAREVESSRAEIDGTLAAIRERMNPGRLAGEAWDFASDSGGGEFVRNLGTSVRDNPLPLLLVGAGVAWLMSGRGGPRLARPDRHDELDYDEDEYDYRRYQGARRRFTAASLYQDDRDDPAYSRPYTPADSDGKTAPEEHEGPGMGERLSEAGERVREAAAGMRRSISESTDRAGDAWDESISSMGERASDLRDRASAYGERVSRGAARLRRDGARRARSLGDRARHAGQRAQEQARRTVDEQPLAVALAGLAIGAIAGALVRTTRTENEWMGEASDRAKAQARDAAREKAEEAAEAVGRTADAVREEAKAQGLTPDDARDAASDLGERVRKVVETGAETARDEADALASGSPGGQA